MSENNTGTLKGWLVILAFIFILTLVGVVWLFLFSDFAFFNAKGLETSNRIDYGAKVLTTIGTIFGGLAVLINAFYAAKRAEAMEKSAIAANESAIAALKNAEAALKNAVIAEDKQITERFAKAIEQLGSEKIEVRLGAIYTLERIAKDSAKDHWTIMEILTAFVRENAPRKTEEDTAQQIPKLRTDIQAALTVLGRRNCENDKENQSLNLSNIDIRGANLQGADLRRANLHGSSLFRANLNEAFLRGSDMQGTWLRFAKLQEADLTGVENLEQGQIDEAKGDRTTKLPDHLKYPEHWQ